MFSKINVLNEWKTKWHAQFLLILWTTFSNKSILQILCLPSESMIMFILLFLFANCLPVVGYEIAHWFLWFCSFFFFERGYVANLKLRNTSVIILTFFFCQINRKGEIVNAFFLFPEVSWVVSRGHVGWNKPCL